MESVAYAVNFDDLNGSMSRSDYVVMSEQVLPTHTNAHGIVFGGQIMMWMDICAGIASKRFCRSAVVTASMDDLHFRNTVKLGSILTVRAKVNRTFRTSMEVGVVVEAENTLNGDGIFVCSGYFIFVAVDEDGNPIPVPTLVPKTLEEQRLHEEAAERKELRQKLRRPSLSESPLTQQQIEFNPALPSKKASESSAEVTQLVLVSHANTIGVTFGGQIMAWMESCALIAAMRHSRRQCVTVSVDSLRFLLTINVGDAVLIKAKVNNVFHTSMEVGVEVYSENLITGEYKHCNTAFFTFLAIESGRPVPVPNLVTETESEKTSFQEALIRRRWRMERKVLFEDIEMNTFPSEQKLLKTKRKLIEALAPSDDWEQIEFPHLEGLPNSKLRVWFKDSPVLSISEERMCCMKGELFVHAPPEYVLEAFSDLDKRLSWDSLFSDGKLVQQVDSNNRLLYMVSKPIKDIKIDFCILQHHYTLDGELKEGIRYIISERSTKSSQVPKKDKLLRGQIFAPSGVVITQEDIPILEGSPETHRVTRVVYVVRQMGTEALGADIFTQWEAFVDALTRLRSYLSSYSPPS